MTTTTSDDGREELASMVPPLSGWVAGGGVDGFHDQGQAVLADDADRRPARQRRARPRSRALHSSPPA